MKITVEPTEEFFMAGDVMVGMWQGTADFGDGRPDGCVALIAAITISGQAEVAARPSLASGQWPTNLVSIPPPTEDDARRWAAEVLSKRYG